MWFKYPYTSYNELNLDWFLSQFKELTEAWDAQKVDYEQFKLDVTTEFNTLSGKFDNLKDVVETFTAFVTNYFDNLDVQQEINNKLDAMVSDGTMESLLLPLVTAQVGPVVTDWLNDNVDPVGSAVIVDSSLTVSGAAADAKVVGDHVFSLASFPEGIAPDFANIHTNVNSGTATESSGTVTIVNTSGYNGDVTIPFPVVAGHTYNISLKGQNISAVNYFGLSKVGADQVIHSYDRIGQFTEVSEKYVYSNFTPASTGYVYIYLNFLYSGSTVTVTLSDIKISDLTLKPEWDPDVKYVNGSVPLAALESIKLSDYDNDEGFVSSEPPRRLNRNLLDPDELETGIILITDGTVNTAQTDFETTDYIPVKEGYEVFGGSYDTVNKIFRDQIYRYAFYDADKTFLSGGQNNNYTQTTIVKITIPAGAKFFRYSGGSSYFERLNFATTTELLPDRFAGYAYEPYHGDIRYLNDTDWHNKTMLTYGDSIVGIGNGDGIQNGWQFYVASYFGLVENHNRGVGGQTFVWNNDTFEVDVNGNYVNRGTAADNCKGTFCSWERVSKMIPDSIKDDIDLVIIMGGTNDFGSNLVSSDIGESINFSSDNNLDTDWISASEYTGGDYDITTVKGGVASTIMKIQARCPQATIVVATPISGRGTSKNLMVNNRSLTLRDYAEAIAEAAAYMSVPVIDVNGIDGINQMNYATYITDGIHPYTFAGAAKLATAICSGLKAVANYESFN